MFLPLAVKSEQANVSHQMSQIPLIKNETIVLNRVKFCCLQIKVLIDYEKTFVCKSFNF